MKQEQPSGDRRESPAFRRGEDVNEGNDRSTTGPRRHKWRRGSLNLLDQRMRLNGMRERIEQWKLTTGEQAWYSEWPYPGRNGPILAQDEADSWNAVAADVMHLLYLLVTVDRVRLERQGDMEVRQAVIEARNEGVDAQGCVITAAMHCTRRERMEVLMDLHAVLDGTVQSLNNKQSIIEERLREEAVRRAAELTEPQRR